MTMQSVSLSALEASAANPRRTIDRKTIEGLAASIRTDGLLHNLVVSPVKGKGKSQRFQIVSGARRFHAPSASNQGVIKIRTTTLNQNDEAVQVQIANLIVPLRAALR
jgi:hypothetical protein